KDDYLIRNADNKFSSGGRVNRVERDDESDREENRESIHRQLVAADRKSGSRSCANPCDAPFRVAVVAAAPSWRNRGHDAVVRGSISQPARSDRALRSSESVRAPVAAHNCARSCVIRDATAAIPAASAEPARSRVSLSLSSFSCNRIS